MAEPQIATPAADQVVPPTLEEMHDALKNAAAAAKTGDKRAAAAARDLATQIHARQQQSPAFRKPGSPAAPPPPKAFLGEGSWTDLAADVAKSAVSGVGKGFAGLPGMLADIPLLIQAGTDWGKSKVQGRPLADIKAETAKNAIVAPETLENISSHAFQKRFGPEGGWYEPRSGLGNVAQVGGVFGPSALVTAPLGGVRSLAALASIRPLARGAVTQGVIPGIASESVGQALEHGIAPEYADAARLVTALGVGGASAFREGARVGRGDRILKPHVDNITFEQFNQAQGLVDDARRIGVTLEPGLALDYVTKGGSGLSGLLAQVGRLPGRPGAIVREASVDQPQQIQAAAQRSIEGISPTAASEGDLGRQINQMVGDIRAESPTGQQLTAQVAAAPRVTPEQAGMTIQQQLMAQEDAMRAARDAVANPLYRQAHAGPPLDPTGVIQRGERVADPLVGRMGEAYETGLNMIRQAGGSPEALHNARIEIDRMIRNAARSPEGAGDVQRLTNLRQDLDQLLKTQGTFRTADAAYAAESTPLAPYERAPLQDVVERQQYDRGRTVLQPEASPGVIEKGGARGARDLAGEALPGTPARQAFENHLATQYLDEARSGVPERPGVRPEHRFDAAKLEAALAKDADALAAFPEVRDRLAAMAASRRALEERGLTGRLRQLWDKGEASVTNAIGTLFPGKAGPLGAQETAEAFRLLNQRDPQATQQLLRHFIETHLEGAMEATQGQSRAMAGAKFVKALGDPGSPRSQTVLAAIREVAGNDAAEGFGRLKEILAATGMRKAEGSPTLGTSAVVQKAGEGGAVQEAAVAGAASVATGSALPVSGFIWKRVGEGVRNRLMEATMTDVGRILSRPEGLAQLRAIKQAGGVGERTAVALNRLAFMLEREEAINRREPMRIEFTSERRRENANRTSP